MFTKIQSRLSQAKPDSDLHAALLAIIAVVPVYLVLSVSLSAMLEARLASGLEQLPEQIRGRVEFQVSVAQRAGIGGFAHDLVSPSVDDRIRIARAAIAGIDESESLAVESRSEMRAVFRDSVLAKLFGFEQLFCYVLAAWAIIMLRIRLRALSHERIELQSDPFGLEPGQLIDPGRAADLHQPLLAAGASSLAGSLHRVLTRALLRFEVAKDVAAAESVVSTEAGLLADSRDADLGLVRFATWAIPSIGFIGTVRGIGSALSVADSPENIGEIVSYLAVAFDTTLIALMLSIVVMYLLHHYQRMNDSMTERLVRRCDEVLIGHLTTEGGDRHAEGAT